MSEDESSHQTDKVQCETLSSVLKSSQYNLRITEDESSSSDSSSGEQENSATDDEYTDWTTSELERQIDEQLQSDLDNQFEKYLSKELDQQIEEQLDDLLRAEMNDRFQNLLLSSTLADNNPATASHTKDATVSNINGQIEKIIQRYESKDHDAHEKIGC
jgi:hypothetical protein